MTSSVFGSLVAETGTQAVARFAYQGIVIRDRDGKLNLTDMWRAAGAFSTQQPAKWREMEGTKAFVSHVANVILRKSEDEAFQVDRGGREPGTWAHWQIGLAYAKYLSPAFHAWCNSTVREVMEGKIGRPEELVAPGIPQTYAEALDLFRASVRCGMLEVKPPLAPAKTALIAAGA